MLFYVSGLALLLLGGCSLTTLPHHNTSSTNLQIDKLNRILIDLNETINPIEAEDFAQKIIIYSHILAKKYDVVAPALWHNTLVNIGIRERGLCYEWSDDLLKYLLIQNYKTLQFYSVVSDRNNYFEHNALAVLAKGDNLKNSIVLDAWRNSGSLFFVKIKDDKSYNWEKRVGKSTRSH
jgi:hypothetical protein